jgi:hypothetical protein
VQENAGKGFSYGWPICLCVSDSVHPGSESGSTDFKLKAVLSMLCQFITWAQTYVVPL